MWEKIENDVWTYWTRKLFDEWNGERYKTEVGYVWPQHDGTFHTEVKTGEKRSLAYDKGFESAEAAMAFLDRTTNEMRKILGMPQP